MSITKDELDRALKHQSENIVAAIDQTVEKIVGRELDERLGDLEQKVLTKIDRLEPAQLETRIQRLEKSAAV